MNFVNVYHMKNFKIYRDIDQNRWLKHINSNIWNL